VVKIPGDYKVPRVPDKPGDPVIPQAISVQIVVVDRSHIKIRQVLVKVIYGAVEMAIPATPSKALVVEIPHSLAIIDGKTLVIGTVNSIHFF